MKKQLLTFSFALNLIGFCSISLDLCCSTELSPDIEALLDDTIFEVQAPVSVVSQENCFPTESILSLLTPPTNPTDNPPVINLVALLREDIYKKTIGPVTRRSLLDLPALTPDYFYNNYWTVTADLFFNFTPKVYFTKDSAFLRDYIDLNNKNIINELSNTEFINVDVPGVLGLFSTIKLQQYRAGIMAGFARQWENWLLYGKIPLYYLLENFFLTDQEIDRIKNNTFFTNDDAGIGSTPEDEARKFGLKHLVCDRFGVGDTRLAVLCHPYTDERQDVWFGLQTTIPTAHTFAKALIAGEFDPDAPLPPLNLQHFFNVFFCNENQALANAVIKSELTNFLVDTLDRLSTILINAPLGNGKHFGLGPEFNWRYHFNDYFSTHTYASAQAYTPHNETRFFLIEKQEKDFDRNWRDPALAGENLAVLNRLIVQTLFPLGIRTSVHPGPRFQFNQTFMYKSEHCDLSLGVDYWYQGSERLELLLPEVPFDLPLVKSKALRPAAQQVKLFAGAGYYGTIDITRYPIDWYVCLQTDATVLTKGIGISYTVALRTGLEF